MPKFNITIRKELVYEIEIDAKDQEDADEVAEQILSSQEYRQYIADDEHELVSVEPIDTQAREAA